MAFAETQAQIQELQAQLRQETPGVYLIALTEADLLAAIDGMNFTATHVKESAQQQKASALARTFSDIWNGIRE